MFTLTLNHENKRDGRHATAICLRRGLLYASGGDFGLQDGHCRLVLVVEGVSLEVSHPVTIGPGEPSRSSAGVKLVRPVGRCTLTPALTPLPGGWADGDGMTSRGEVRAGAVSSHRLTGLALSRVGL